MIIQENDNGIPDDTQWGGNIRFDFDAPVLFADIGLMDMDESAHTFKFTFADGATKTYSYVGYGDNGVQRVITNQYNVVQLEMYFPRSAAITEFSFCPECGRY